MELVRLGTLRARVLAPPDPRRTVVLLHGFGAPGDDLVALADWLDIPDTAWVFPEAPLELPGLYGDSRAWWMIDLDSIGRLDRDRNEVPPGLADARAAVVELLASLPFDAPLFLGGFSQGAMLALDVALHDPRPLAGLALLSGTLINLADWQPRLAARAGLRVVQSHGLRDELLPYRAAEALRDLLAGAGLDVTFIPFAGGHEIPPPVLDALATAIRDTR